MDDMHDQHETPTSDAARGVGQYLTSALAVSDLSVRLLMWSRLRASEVRPWAGYASRPGAETSATPSLDKQRAKASRESLLAWLSAQPGRELDPEAEAVAARAEERLRHLHPHAMSRYDDLMGQLGPVEAMRRVVPLVVADHDVSTAHELFGELIEVDADVEERQLQAVEPPHERYASVVREVFEAEVADQILGEKAWPTLAAVLDSAQRLGARPSDLLVAAAAERELGSAKSVTQVLAFRVEKQLGLRPPAGRRHPSAADVAALGYPGPVAVRSRGRSQVQGSAPQGAGLELGHQEAVAGLAPRTPSDEPEAAPSQRSVSGGSGGSSGAVGAARASTPSSYGGGTGQRGARSAGPATGAATASYPTPVQVAVAAQRQAPTATGRPRPAPRRSATSTSRRR